jgi:F-type H+-transporting ATPase subunit gamma
VASLREIKDRIGSVRSTLKITSAMKLVASAKLRKAQKAIEALRPYERTLGEILASLQYGGISPEPPAALKSLSDFASKVPGPGRSADADFASLELPRGEGLQNHEGPTAVVAIASNSSLCGGFNANVVRKALETIRGCEGAVEVYPLGRKMAEALRRAGYTADRDYNDLVGHPSYEQSAALARSLAERFERGELARVVLVYTSFVSASRQEPVAETYLPFEGDKILRVAQDDNKESEYLLEPDAAALAAQLLPQVMLLKFHAAILDSAAAEQAARTLAMQTATDNAEDLLGELTLEYNKGRQQKITAEILDLLGGSQQ